MIRRLLTGLVRRLGALFDTTASASPSLVRVPKDGPRAPEAAISLGLRGGVRHDLGASWVFAFPSADEREEALEDVRSRCGWTAAEPLAAPRRPTPNMQLMNMRENAKKWIPRPGSGPSLGSGGRRGPRPAAPGRSTSTRPGASGVGRSP